MAAFLSDVPKDKEIVVSTGGATLQEIDTALNLLSPFLARLPFFTVWPSTRALARIANWGTS